MFDKVNVLLLFSIGQGFTLLDKYVPQGVTSVALNCVVWRWVKEAGSKELTSGNL